ncbi:glycosyltransferase [Pseudomonadota bacterium]
MTDKAYKNGMFVVLLGPDGSGKSTLANGIAQIAESEFQGLEHFHWRPGLLPKLSRQKEGQSTSKKEAAASDAPPTESAYGTIVSLVRYLYYLSDFVIGYWWIIRPQVSRGTLVLGERWYYDVIAYPARYGFKLPIWLLRLGSWLLPNPDLVVLLSADPEVIHARKPELAPALIDEQLHKLRALLPLDSGIEVSSGCDPEQSLRTTRDAILGQRLVSHSASKRGRDSWKGFPGYGEVKVWIGPSDTLKNALRLYHPYSRMGKLVTRIAKVLPNSIASNLLCRKVRTHNESRRLKRILSTLEMLDQRREAVISVSTGTCGPHQKNTAQLSENGIPFAYAKFGCSFEVSALVKNEYLALKRLAASESIRECVPESIGYWEDDEGKESVLVQSTLEQSMSPSPVLVDASVTAFLLMLCDTAGTEMDVKDISRSLGVSELCDELRAKQPEVSRLLHHALTVLKSQHGEKYKVIPSHGDFAPWNVLRSDQNDSLFVIDWEYFDTETPALMDLFHYVYMPMRLVAGKAPLYVVNELIELAQSSCVSELAERCKVSGNEWKRYILWYFLWLAVREYQSGYVSGYLQKCIRILMNKMPIEGVRPKVLVGAYACEPGEGSEPGVGWNWVEQIANEADIHVITRVNNRDAIEKEMAAQPSLNIRFSYIDLPKWASFWKRGQRGVRTYYYLWQFVAYLKAKELESEEFFDLAHHVTFVNDWLWSFVGLLSLPYIWGPIGSHPPCPRHLIARKKNRVQETVRIVIQNTFRILDPLYWLTMLRAARVVAITQESFQKIPLRFVPTARRKVEPAIGMEKLHLSAQVADKESARQVLYVGRYHYTKCPQLVVEAFAKVLYRFPDARLMMIGSGPERQSLEEDVAMLNIRHAVTLCEQLSRQDVLTAMSNADLFLFPSTEGGGMVVLEAMASGIPVVCLNYGGPGEMVRNEGGVCVPLGTKEQVVQGLASAVIDLFEDDVRRQSIGDVARKRVSQCYEWSRKRDFVKAQYQAVVHAEIAHG